MITETQQFFIDILRLIPNEDSSLLVQSPHKEVLSVLEKMNFNDEDGVFKSVELNRRNREILVFEILYNDLDEYINSLAILVEGKKVFEGYDGMEYGTISKNTSLPQLFIEEYVEGDMCTISKDW